jgi:hypothetical protein
MGLKIFISRKGDSSQSDLLVYSATECDEIPLTQLAQLLSKFIA